MRTLASNSSLYNLTPGSSSPRWAVVGCSVFSPTVPGPEVAACRLSQDKQWLTDADASRAGRNARLRAKPPRGLPSHERLQDSQIIQVGTASRVEFDDVRGP